MKRNILIAAGLLVLIAWWQPLNINRTEVVIPDSLNARQIAQRLSDEHVLRNVDEFLLWLRIMGREKELKAGKYEFYRYKNPFYVIGQLTRGGRSEIIVTIPEGSTVDETAAILEGHGLVDAGRFIELCRDDSVIEEFGLRATSLEGYLFPDTYSFSDAQDEASVIATLLANFRKRAADLGVVDRDSLHRAVILASIVEREAKYEDERPVIARVFINRLNTNRPLESCATIYYVLKSSGKYIPGRKLSDRDLRVESPYNTYQNPGLPPGPICSPGESSMRAALAPADVDYLYFVARGDGRHHFSRTFREHAAAKEQYQ